MSEKVRIVAVAARSNLLGFLYALPKPSRHSDLISETTKSGFLWSGFTAGFLTNEGRFVDRDKAWYIAAAAGQILPRDDLTPGTLYSEDLW
ncbi:MAG: hypothetical protein GTN64_05580 [Candidatus Latescibacteria bacterium]|nr:hypothetical protein [Candidatus Latescibacterota bacterium]NIO78080.1 hypothetical protein [Candidatus Latescibacterota bacterium]